MDVRDFLYELNKYKIVRSSDWERKWDEKLVENGVVESKEGVEEVKVTSVVPVIEREVEDFFQGLHSLLRENYGRELGDKIATQFKMDYFRDIDRLSLEDIEDLAACHEPAQSSVDPFDLGELD
mmetsp:Transcript_3038/g.4518  ORF Transcript_3038/g.4518 Transcript_3038/m.4518 type:complete len:124 (-) Transcript_3038:56-427(-)